LDQFSLDFFSAPEPEPPPAARVRRRTFTVSELNAEIRSTLAGAFEDVWVAGEISGVRVQPSGHCYFTLKERDSQIRCVCFKSSYRYLRCKPQDGLAILARGRLDVFEARGEYQVLVEMLEPQGYGALQLAFEQLKKRLLEEGLFEASRKRELPKFPQRIGIVTSPRGAVISDILQILARRFPGLHVRVYPALVQGEGSVDEVCRGIRHFADGEWADLLIVARGGGSLEDLWTFNEESVARAMVASKIPVVSAIGHETDVTIADFVADLRAPTPSAAAELIICTKQELLDRLTDFEHRAVQYVRYRHAMFHRRLEQQAVGKASALLQRNIGKKFQRTDDLDYRLREFLRAQFARRLRWLELLTAKVREHDLRHRVERARVRLERADRSLAEDVTRRLNQHARALDLHESKLGQLSPLRILDRGYAIVTKADGVVVKSLGELETGELLDVRVASGHFSAEVRDKRQPE
jgi:exodeoxyribonuclease VII large subunit